MRKYIVDTSLRDGEQAPGVMFSSQQKMAIARMLDVLKIDEVEVGTPAMGLDEINTIYAIAHAGFSFKTTAWARALEKDIIASAQCETDAVSISFPVSHVQLEALGKTPQWIMREMPRLLAFARQYFDKVYVGFQDATRCDLIALKTYITLAENCGVDRIRIADTVGIMNPLTTQHLFSTLSDYAPQMDFEFHAHNDLGMATANAFMAMQSGAQGVSATINGLGERAGNTAIEELIMAMRLHEKVSRYQTTVLKDLCHYVAEASEQALALSKPIVGAHAFTHETGIHVKSLLKNKMTYQAFDEAIVGHHSNRIVIGKHSGRHAIADYYVSRGFHLEDEHLDPLYRQIQAWVHREGRNPDDHILMACYNAVVEPLISGV